MNEKEKYKLQEKLRYDKAQTELDEKGLHPNTKFYAIKKLEIKYDEKILCPFCFNYDEFQLFNKEGRLYKCPICKNCITLKTANDIRFMTSEQFAKWVFDYRLSGFWDKIINKDFKEWNKRLYDVGFGFGINFWDNYKILKGTAYCDGD